MSKQVIPWTGCQPELASHMTLRDYFAAAVLQECCASYENYEEVAREAYRFADAMLVERAKGRRMT